MSDSLTGKIVIPSQLDQVHPVQQQLIDTADSAGFDKQTAFGLRLALDEALTNAIRHGNQLDPAKHVDIVYQFSDERLEITICDQGPGFDPADIDDPRLDKNLVRPEGRGVLLMKAYMSEVHFNASGNCVTLIRTRDDERPQANQL